MNKITLTDLNGTEFLATPEQAEALESLAGARAGGFATVYGYQPSTNYISKPVQDIQFIARFSTENLYRRKMEALSNITLADIEESVKDDPVLNAMDRDALIALFNTRKAGEVASMAKTLEGSDRSDAHRQGHDRCYAKMADGLRVHFVTEKDSDGLKQPVLENGLPVVDSIMIHYLEINKTTRVKGVKKTVNSGAAVRMSNAIANCLNSRSVGLRTMSLKADNFERIVLNRKTYLPEDVSGIDASILNG